MASSDDPIQQHTGGVPSFHRPFRSGSLMRIVTIAGRDTAAGAIVDEPTTLKADAEEHSTSKTATARSMIPVSQPRRPICTPTTRPTIDSVVSRSPPPGMRNRSGARQKISATRDHTFCVTPYSSPCRSPSLNPATQSPLCSSRYRSARPRYQSGSHTTRTDKHTFQFPLGDSVTIHSSTLSHTSNSRENIRPREEPISVTGTQSHLFAAVTSVSGARTHLTSQSVVITTCSTLIYGVRRSSQLPSRSRGFTLAGLPRQLPWSPC